MSIRLSVAIAGENAEPSAFVVWRGFADSFRKASELGFHGVELALKTASDISGKELERLLSKHGLEVSCISTGQVFAALGLYFTHPDADVRKRLYDVFFELIDLASEHGRLVNIGRARGFIAPGADVEGTKQIFAQALGPVREYAIKRGVKLIIEPVNRYEINFINSVDEGSELINSLGLSGVGLMPDVFHMNIEDDKIGGSLIRNKDNVAYIHMADSNRLAPGWGHLDFDDVFDAIAAINYDGWLSVEILPKPDPDSAAAQAVGFLLPRINKINQARA